MARHFVIQTAFEELGGRNRNAIHSRLYASSLDAGAHGESAVLAYIKRHSSTRSLLELRKYVESISGTSEVMGLCLGLELPANENISAILNAVGHSEEIRGKLLKTPFFRIHRVVEDEHIRLSVANFLHFCRSESEALKFMRAFDLGIVFWRDFWGEAGFAINARSTR